MKVYTFLLFSCFIAYGKAQYIAGGEAVNITEYPYAASLQYTGSGADQTCGGVVLSATALLSAASCFYTANGALYNPGDWRARVGSSFVSTDGRNYTIRLITAHPDFELTTRDNNIAVLRTVSFIELVPGLVEVARIAGGAFTIAPRNSISAIGWGAAKASEPTEQLHHVSAFVIDQETCAVRYQDINFAVTDNMICFGWLDVGVFGQCSEGGAGSPIVVNGGVVGIHSWSNECASLRYPSLNTRTSPYWKWIVDTANAGN
ncbi:trypsin, alkaline A-like [Galleria mellonella]|uniref:Trypsin, alkaline A-like n=1 Tax=Galleria mellonella TaxID=7137 RepID=A0A6J1WYI2_GALME|nr:trypsin, alkaline A-like [Galleria mellonella]